MKTEKAKQGSVTVIVSGTANLSNREAMRLADAAMQSDIRCFRYPHQDITIHVEATVENRLAAYMMDKNREV